MLTEEKIRQQLSLEAAMTAEVLSVQEDWALALLVHYRWRAYDLEDDWEIDQAAVRNAVGLRGAGDNDDDDDRGVRDMLGGPPRGGDVLGGVRAPLLPRVLARLRCRRFRRRRPLPRAAVPRRVLPARRPPRNVRAVLHGRLRPAAVALVRRRAWHGAQAVPCARLRLRRQGLRRRRPRRAVPVRPRLLLALRRRGALAGELRGGRAVGA